MEDVEEAPPVYGPMPRDAKEVPDKGKAPKEDERGRKRERTNDRSAKKRRNRSSSDSSSSKSGRSSHGRFHRKRKKSPSPPSSPSNSDNEASSKPSSPPHKAKHKRRKHPAWKRSEKLQKFKEGGKNITFLTFDGTYGDTIKYLTLSINLMLLLKERHLRKPLSFDMLPCIFKRLGDNGGLVFELKV